MARNIFRNAFSRVIEARERQARHYVNDTLLTFDDAMLKTLGRRREDILRDSANVARF